jgi:hypothetical protein
VCLCGDATLPAEEILSLMGDSTGAALTRSCGDMQGPLSLEFPAPHATPGQVCAPVAHRPAQAPRGRRGGVLLACEDTRRPVMDGLL